MAVKETIIEVTARVKDETSSGLSKIERSFQKVQKEMEKFKKMNKLEATLYAVDKASKVIDAVFKKGKDIAGKVWNVTLKAVDFVTAPVRGILKMLSNPVVAFGGMVGISVGVADLVNTYKNFEQGMANVKAITRGTNSEMEKLTNTAKKLGEETMFSAQQVSEAMEFLAMAGWKTNDIIGGMPGLLDLAAAGGINVAMAADVVSSALAQFNMNAKESGRVADVLAAVATNSKTDVAGLGESLKYAGTVAGSMGYDIADVAVALGLMGNVGLAGSMSGTAMRSIMSRMGGKDELDIMGESDSIAKAMGRLNVSLYNAKGEAKPLMDVLMDLRKGFAGLREDEVQGTAQDIAGMYGKAGLLAIVNASEEKFNQLTNAMADSVGVAKEMAGVRMDTVQGSIYYLQSAVEGLKISFMDRFQPHLKEFLGWLTSKIPDLKNIAMDFADFATNKLVSITKSVENMLGSPAWQSAETLWDKIKVAWDKIIAEPFNTWWGGSGKAWLADKMGGIGEGIGKGITFAVSSLFGLDIGTAAADGISVGKSFAEGFAKGFEQSKITDALSKAFKAAAGLVFSNPVTGGLASLWLGGKVLGSISGAYTAAQGIKGVAGSVGKGISIANAAATGGAASQSALVFARSGKFGVGAQVGAGLAGAGTKITAGLGSIGTALGSGATTVGGLAASGAAGVAGGVLAASALVGGLSDLYKGLSSKSNDASSAYKSSGIKKLGGAAVGATIGTLILPGFGTLVGAGLGGLAGMIAGNRDIEKYKAKVAAAQKEAVKKQAEFEAAVRDNLDSHFGKIKLSVNEIQNMAEKIVFGNSVKSLEQFANAADKAQADVVNFRSAAEQMDWQNWKIGLGFELSSEDIDDYISSVDNFMLRAAEAVQSKHYEATAALNVLYTEGEGGDKMTAVNALYASIQRDISIVEAELREKTKIFLGDGVITLDEQAEIANLQGQISSILDMVAKAEQEASFELLKVKYGGAALDAESFEALQSELTTQIQLSIDNHDEAFKARITTLGLEYEKAKINADGDQQKIEAAFADYQSQLEQEAVNYNLKINQLHIGAEDFQLDAIAQAYGPELERVFEHYDVAGTTAEKLKAALNNALGKDFDPFNWDEQKAAKWLGLSSLEEVTRKNITSLMTEVAKTIPESVRAGIEVNSTTDIFSKPSEKMMGVIEQSLKPIVQTSMKLIGEQVPNTVSAGMSDKASEGTRPGCEAVYKAAGFNMRQEFSKPFDVDVKVNMNADYKWNAPGTVPRPEFKAPYTPSSELKASPHAEGGIMTRPHLGLVAEDGAEAIIPLSDKRRERGIALWRRAGQMLGVKQYADGGIAGFGNKASGYSFDNTDSTPAAQNIFAQYFARRLEILQNINQQALPNANNNPSAPVNVNILNFNVSRASTEEIMRLIKENIPGITEQVAHEIAVNIQKNFLNTPLEVV